MGNSLCTRSVVLWKGQQTVNTDLTISILPRTRISGIRLLGTDSGARALDMYVSMHIFDYVYA